MTQDTPLAAHTLDRPALLRRMTWEPASAPDWAPLVDREWLVTNGLGGYASGTVGGAATRRYHGLLVAACPPPLGRVLLLASIAEAVVLPGGRTVRLGGEERPDALALHGAEHLQEFRLDHGLPAWTYALGETRLEKRVVLPHAENTVLLRYTVLAGGPIRLSLRPLLDFRGHDAPVGAREARAYRVRERAGALAVSGDGGPTLHLRFDPEGARWDPDPEVVQEVLYRVEASRGYSAVGDVWSAGRLEATVGAGGHLDLSATAEDPPERAASDFGAVLAGELERRRRLIEAAGAAEDPVGAELVLAADAFIIAPPRRERQEAADTDGGRGPGEAAAGRGRSARSIIAGYHWFTDWGRDTMISLEGLTLTTGRHTEAAAILRLFAAHVRNGLIPNLFPEGTAEGLYHTADATLWFFHAVHRYVEATGDRRLLAELLPKLRDIVDAHVRGTRFGIGVDPDDGLLRQGADGYQLTWMDAKVDGWVVTPRRGKAVEINALWYNALRLMEDWLGAAGDGAGAAELGELARRARASFNARFWNEAGYLYDVVDGEEGDDDAFRPNQVFAIALDHPVLDEARWASVMEAVEARLLTPVGLRSLAPGHPDYRERYFGDLRTRDAAYHQGTVWGWLIGPFVDAWLRVHPDAAAGAAGFLEGLVLHMDEACLGSMSEVFDAEPPHTPRGCVAQAWTVAEVLRCRARVAAAAGVPAELATPER